MRFPTLQELDTVTPSHPVFIQQSFAGPSVTNSLGKAFFESKGIEVGADGALAGGFQTPNSTTRALFALRQMQTLDDMKRGTLDAQRYAAASASRRTSTKARSRPRATTPTAPRTPTNTTCTTRCSRSFTRAG